MLRPHCKINIGENELDFVISGEFTTGWKNITDTGSVTIPKKLKKNDNIIFVGENNLFNKGDYSEISAGYYPVINNLFKGYLANVEPENPVKLTFQDASFLLKQNNITLSVRNTTLKDLMELCLKEAISKAKGYVLEGLKKITIKALDANLGSFRITNVNMTGVLGELKKTYALTSFFRDHTLYVGLAYYPEQADRHVFEFQKDIIDNGTSLEYLKKDDVAVKIKAISMLENNTKIEIELGDEGGEQKTITKYNLTREELKRVAEREASRLRYEGFRGKIMTFLHKPVRHGDEISLIDPRMPEKNGVYLAEEITYKIGIEGYFQEISLGVKVD